MRTRCGAFYGAPIPGPHPDELPEPAVSPPTTEPITEVLMEKRSSAGRPFAGPAAPTTAETVRRGWSTQHTKGS
ncbi:MULTISPECIES: hypothetical protein [unclassified Streptomyces]|uniref:hypothetical protein n=1 Tax=unclassified Streptomyces TaxID=2593676 RepID=UPI0033F8FA54